MKRRRLLAVSSLALIPGCSGAFSCTLRPGQTYHFEDSDFRVLIDDTGDGWADITITGGDYEGEYHMRKVECDDRYCRYVFDSENFNVGLRFDCNKDEVDLYV